MTFDSYITTVTQDQIVPKVVDIVLGSNVLGLRILSNNKPWSGETIKKPLKYQKNTTSQGAFDGFDTFDTTKVNTRVSASFTPTGFYQSIVLNGMEVDVNATSGRVLDLVKVEMESGMQDMIDTLGTNFYTAQTGKNFLSVRDYIDDGNGTASYGGLSRSTYTGYKSTVTAASGGALSLTLLGTQQDAATTGGLKPTIGIMNETVWGLFESLAQPAVSINTDGYAQVTRTGIASTRNALKGELGFDALFQRGMPMVKDEKATSGYLYMMNEPSINFYGLKSHKYSPVGMKSGNIEGNAYEMSTPNVNGFYWTGLKEPVNQYAEIGQILLMGNLIGDNPRLNSLTTGITTA